MFYPGVTLEGMLELYRQDYLQKKGWIRSVEARMALDEKGEPIPWLTYPALSFVAAVVRPEWKVFEYGCGSSTVWWSRHVAEVHAVDHDAAWVEKIKAQYGAKADARLVPGDSGREQPVSPLIERYFAEVKEPPLPADEGYCYRAGLLSERFRNYAAQILRFPPGYFDVVVVDGMARSLTTWLTVEHARPGRLIIFDNSDREVYSPAYAILKNAGYRRIDFWGSGPVNPYEWCTSVFLRNLDVLPT